MPRRRTRSPAQLILHFDSGADHPPAAPPSRDLLQALADLLMAAMKTTAHGIGGREVGDEPEDHA